MDLSKAADINDKMEQVKADGGSYNGIRITQTRSKLPHWVGYNSSSLPQFPHVSKTINPNKAVFTIDANTGHIFIVNNKACQLLGYTSHELRNKPFFDLLHTKTENHISALAEMQIDSDEGTVVLLSGKVVEMKNKQGSKVVVSLWIRQIDNEGRCIAVAEPVERHVCQLQIDRFGTITAADLDTATIFQYELPEHIIGANISALIPSIKLPESDCVVVPKGIRKQRATGRTTDNVKFPLCLLIAPHEYTGSSNYTNTLFDITIWVFQNLSGLIVVDDYGNIQTCNQPFSLLMFGYTQEKILNMQISTLIPNFGKDPYESRSRNISNSSLTSNEWEAESDPVLLDIEIAIPANKRGAGATAHAKENENSLATSQGATLETTEEVVIEKVNEVNVIENKTDLRGGNLENRSTKEFVKALNIEVTSKTEEPDMSFDEAQTPVNVCNDFLSKSVNLNQSNISSSSQAAVSKQISSISIESTPSSASSKLLSCAGNFIGEAIHADGNVIDIMYSVSTQILPCSRRVHCVWICRDPNTVFDNDKNTNLTLTFNSFTSTVEHSLGQVIKTTAAQNSSRPNSLSLISAKYDDELLVGDFGKSYTTLKQIGKGAFGYVKMGFRNSDRLLVITKFILKEKLCAQFMIKNSENKEIPIEIHLLQTLKHPNIVSVLDVFENDLFYQLVMEKHGSGMDLFEFIERRPLMDEKLGSFIFRQIADAVQYLHEQNILHRDIKDENIIIDHNFHIKLIDFGSATFMEEGKQFSTFFGTTEYCSPEVLAGNKYEGPELEMWSLGVTLYVLMFFENPFIDVEETLKADLHIPNKVSEQLSSLLNSMLNKDPANRCTMRQLTNDTWIKQEVNPSMYNFAWIVPCKPHEANPETHFSGHLYSSTSVLSTISPQESLSLVDECSIGCSEDEDCHINKSTADLLQAAEKRATNNQDETTSAKTIMETIDIGEFGSIKSGEKSAYGASSYLSLSKMNVSDISLDRDKKGTSPMMGEMLRRECSNGLMHAILDNCHLQVKDVAGKLSSSKSENNIFQDQKEDAALPMYNVVSLHDVNIKEPSLTYKLDDISNLNISNETFDIHLNDLSLPTK